MPKIERFWEIDNKSEAGFNKKKKLFFIKGERLYLGRCKAVVTIFYNAVNEWVRKIDASLNNEKLSPIFELAAILTTSYFETITFNPIIFRLCFLWTHL